MYFYSFWFKYLYSLQQFLMWTVNLQNDTHKVSYVKRFVDLGACFRQNNPKMNPQIGSHNNSPLCRIFYKSIYIRYLSYIELLIFVRF